MPSGLDSKVMEVFTACELFPEVKEVSNYEVTWVELLLVKAVKKHAAHHSINCWSFDYLYQLKISHSIFIKAFENGGA